MKTKIEWTHWPRPDGTLMPGYTANLWWGCTEVHAGCDNCYARTFANRYKNKWGGSTLWGTDEPRREIHGVWANLEKWNREAAKANECRAVFVGSMMDIFEKPMPVVGAKGNRTSVADTGVLRNDLFNYIDKGYYPNLIFLLLTKRPSNINKYIPESWKENPPENVMFGTSVSNQDHADHILEQLAEVKGKKFVSLEPQLTDVWFKFSLLQKMDWVIQGGESGGGKRPFNKQWAGNMQYQCSVAGVPYFFKQIDKVQPIPDELLKREYPKL